MKKKFNNFLTILEVLFIIAFIVWSIKTNSEQCSRIFFVGLEISAVSIYHLYEKWKKNIN